MNRIEKKKIECGKKKMFITYMTAGLPNMEETAAIVKAQEEAGVDMIELGIPFSDPIADGPVIQEASYQSIQNGTNLKKVFEMVKDLRKDCSVPIIFMLYYNTILYYGIEQFINRCIECGVDGIIVPDLPYEETFEIKEALKGKEDELYLIPLVSPLSKERIPKILDGAKGFVYCVSSMGVTGQNADFHNDIQQYLTEVKNQSDIPVMLGFGIHTAKDVEPYKEIIDGCIVGTHFIKLMEESKFDLNTAKEYITTFKSELNS